jgi:hypothetical protein
LEYWNQASSGPDQNKSKVTRNGRGQLQYYSKVNPDRVGQNRAFGAFRAKRFRTALGFPKYIYTAPDIHRFGQNLPEPGPNEQYVMFFCGSCNPKETPYPLSVSQNPSGVWLMVKRTKDNIIKDWFGGRAPAGFDQPIISGAAPVVAAVDPTEVAPTTAAVDPVNPADSSLRLPAGLPAIGAGDGSELVVAESDQMVCDPATGECGVPGVAPCVNCGGEGCEICTPSEEQSSGDCCGGGE